MARDDYKTRNWVTIVYPESAPKDWRDKLRDECIQAVVSPLHNADANPDGEQKKEHYHVMLLFDGPKRQSMAQGIVDLIGGVGCKACNSVRGYARYLCHLDNPEKAQYKETDVECFGGANYLDLISLPSDRYLVIDQMKQWCREQKCVSYRWLMDYASEREPAWYRELCNTSTRLMLAYLKALKWELDTYGVLMTERKPAKVRPTADDIELERREQMHDLADWLSIVEEDETAAMRTEQCRRAQNEVREELLAEYDARRNVICL